jgi:hypothetical protein
MGKKLPGDLSSSEDGIIYYRVGFEEGSITHQALLKDLKANSRYRYPGQFIGALLDDRYQKLAGNTQGPWLWFPDPRYLQLMAGQMPLMAVTPQQQPAQAESEDRPDMDRFKRNARRFK